MDAYQVRTWQGWHQHMALSLMGVWFLIGETHWSQQVTPALTLLQLKCCSNEAKEIWRAA